MFCEEAEPSLLISDQIEPATYKEACKNADCDNWHAAMCEEMDALVRNQTWDLVSLPPDRKALRNKWVYKLKDEADGHKRFRARLVVKGYAQQQDLDFKEIFSPVVKMTTI